MSLLSQFLLLQLLLLRVQIHHMECMIENVSESTRWTDPEGHLEKQSDDDCTRIQDDKFSLNTSCLNEEDTIPSINCSCTFYNSTGGVYSCGGDYISSIPNLTRHISHNEVRLYCLTGARKVNQIKPFQFVGTRITNMKITNMEQLKLEEHAFGGISNLQTLTLRFNNFGQLGKPDHIFAGLVNLTVLDLSNNQITGWDTSSTDGQDDNVTVLPELQTLNLSGNPLEDLNNAMFKWLWGSKLRYLSLKSCYIKSIEPGTLIPVSPTLYTIDLESSFIPQSIIVHLLNGMNSIRGLGLAKIGLTDVPYDVLRVTNNTLQYLILYGNVIRTLDTDIKTKIAQEIRSEVFPSLPVLKELDLRSCSIYHIQEGTFSRMRMPKLKTLLLSNNQIVNISNLSSTRLPELTYLDLSHNLIQLENFNLTKYPALEILDLSYTSCQYLHKNMFMSENINLKNLSLCFAKLKSIENDAFKHFGALKALDISGNTELGTNLSNDSFKGLTSLEELHLAECNINLPSASVLLSENKVPEILPLHSLTKLRKLNLSKNDIRTIPNITIHHLNALESLDLSNNFIRSWNEPVFHGHSNVRSFNIGHNYLNYITDAMLIDFKNLTTLIISSNPFVCDCNCLNFWNMVNEITGNSYDVGFFEPRSQIYSDKRVKLPQPATVYKVIETKGGFKALYSHDNSDPFTSEWNVNEEYLCINKSSTSEVNLIYFHEAKSSCNKQTPSKNGNISVVEKEENETVIITVVAVSLLVVTFGGITYWKWWYIRYFAILIKNATILSFMTEEDESALNKIFTYDVFISYSDHNREWVLNNLLTNLESKSNLKVCLHERDFQVGIGILENIIASMDKSRCILLVISHQFLRSQWCQFELHLAQHRLLETRREELILLFLEDIPKVKRPKTLQFLMKTKTYIQWPERADDKDAKIVFWKRLHNAVLRNSAGMEKKYISLV